MSDTMSPTVDQLAAALASCQMALRGAVKDSVNPHLRNRYADLASVWEACREALAANGLSVVQGGVKCGDGWALRTTLMHASGQWVSGDVPLAIHPQKGINDMQAVGVAITYARRYGLASIVGVIQEDPDGNGAGTPHGDEPRSQPKPVDKPLPPPPTITAATNAELEEAIAALAEWEGIVDSASDVDDINGRLHSIARDSRKYTDYTKKKVWAWLVPVMEKAFYTLDRASMKFVQMPSLPTP